MADLEERYRSLTERERDIMALVVVGRLNKLIAAELGLAEVTVKAHRSQIMHKMGAKSLPELVRMADRLERRLREGLTSRARSTLGNRAFSGAPPPGTQNWSTMRPSIRPCFISRKMSFPIASRRRVPGPALHRPGIAEYFST